MQEARAYEKVLRNLSSECSYQVIKRAYIILESCLRIFIFFFIIGKPLRKVCRFLGYQCHLFFCPRVQFSHSASHALVENPFVLTFWICGLHTMPLLSFSILLYTTALHFAIHCFTLESSHHSKSFFLKNKN